MADPTPIKPKQPSHLIPVVTVILAMSALVGVFAYSQWPTEKDETITPVLVHKATNTTANANTAVNTNAATNTNTVSNTNGASDTMKDWKTYTDKTYGYSFKYPPTITFDTSAASTTHFVFGSYSPNPPEEVTAPGSMYLEVSVSDHRLGEVLRLSDSEIITKPTQVSLSSGTAVWGAIESGADQVQSQLQFFGQEQDLLLHVTVWGATSSSIAAEIFSTLTIPDHPSTTAAYRLRCFAAPFTDNTVLSQPWWKKFSSQIIDGWAVNEACLNESLQQVVYEKSNDSKGQSLIGVYTIATDSFVKATPRRAIYGGECAGHISWDIKTGIISYRCGSGDAGAYWFGEYTFNPVNQANTKIRECSGDANENTEQCS